MFSTSPLKGSCRADARLMRWERISNDEKKRGQPLRDRAVPTSTTALRSPFPSGEGLFAPRGFFSFLFRSPSFKRDPSCLEAEAEGFYRARDVHGDFVFSAAQQLIVRVNGDLAFSRGFEDELFRA